MHNTVTLKAKFGLFPEGQDQLGSAADALESLGGSVGDTEELQGLMLGGFGVVGALGSVPSIYK